MGSSSASAFVSHNVLPTGKQCTTVPAQCPIRMSTSNRGPARTVATAAVAALLALAPIQPNIGAVYAAKGGGDTFTSASGDVIKDGESLLRWSLPIENKPVRELQSYLEAVISDITGLKWNKMDSDVKRAAMVLNKSGDEILACVPAERREAAASELEAVKEGVPRVADAVTDKKKVQVKERARDVLRHLGNVESAMVTGFPYKVPSEFDSLPQLKGRATVQMTVKKGTDDDYFDIDGVLKKTGSLTMVVDGYSAPVNAGSFIDLVSKGFYNGLPVIRSDGFIVQSGKPSNSEGYVDSSGNVRSVPLEVFPRGDKTPMYGITLEDDGRGTASTVLPFSSYGTLAMARKEFEPNTASSQFFWFLFEPDLTPAGRNLLDGSWSVVGYTTNGQEFLRGLQKGDTIVEAKVVDGLENLVTKGGGGGS